MINRDTQCLLDIEGHWWFINIYIEQKLILLCPRHLLLCILYVVCLYVVCCMLIGVFCLFSSTSCILYNLHLCMLYGSIPIKGRRQNCGFKSLLTKAFYLSRLAILLHNEIHKTTMLSGFLLYKEFWDNNVSFNYYY